MAAIGLGHTTESSATALPLARRRCPCAPATRRSSLANRYRAHRRPGGNAGPQREEEAVQLPLLSKTASSNRARVNAATCGAAQRSDHARRTADRRLGPARHERHAWPQPCCAWLHARRRARPRFASSCVRAARRHAHAALGQLRDQRAVTRSGADAGARVSLEAGERGPSTKVTSYDYPAPDVSPRKEEASPRSRPGCEGGAGPRVEITRRVGGRHTPLAAWGIEMSVIRIVRLRSA